ncbi:MAG: hypothetical protein IJ449_05615 [Clostridia bacterium]|nr:hypothetical protein [Clostridia bacterium]
MKKFKRIFFLVIVCMMVLSMSISAAVHRTCNCTGSVFTYDRAQNVPQWNDYYCKGSYVTFHVFTCNICGGEMYRDEDCTFYIVEHEWDGDLCTKCGNYYLG